MATFVLCRDGNRAFYVNTELVRVVEKGPNYTTLQLDKDHTVNIIEPPEHISNATGRPV